MPGFELGHLIAIFFIAFLVLGPARMVEIARSLGKFSQQAQGEWVKFSQSFQSGLSDTDTEPAETATIADTTPTEAATPTAGAAPTTESAAVTEGVEPATVTASEAAPAKSTAITPTPVAQSKPPAKKKKKSKKKEALSISDHLLDLRTALVRSLVAIVLLTLVAYIFSDTLLAILRAPAESAGITKLIALSPMDGFLIHFRIAMYGGIFMSAPVWIFEAMRFIAPALLPHEKRLIIPGIVAAMILFILGNVFGYMMLQNMMSVMFTMFGKELEYFPNADPFISFVVFFLIAVGISFELPIIMLIFIRIGWLSADMLRRQRKIAYFIIFVFAELITPVADPIIAPMVVMFPMIVLFELALLVARLITPKPAAKTSSAS